MMKSRVLQESPPCCAIGADLLQHRFDAPFYEPRWLRMDAKLRLMGESVSLREIIDTRKSGYGCLPDSDDYGGGSVGLIRGGELSQTTLNELPLDSPRIAESYLSRYEGSRAYPGDVLMLVKGATIAKPDSAAILSPLFSDKALFNGSVFRLTVDQSVDPYFVVAQLKAPTFLNQKERSVSNTGIWYLDQETLLSLQLIRPPKEIQIAIGNKLRAAERLRAEAVKSKKTINAWVCESLPTWDEPSDVLAVAPVFTDDFRTERLDPWYNHSQFTRLQNMLCSLRSLVPLNTLCEIVSDRWSSNCDEIEYIEIGEFDLTQGIVHGKTIAGEFAPSRAQIAARAGDLAVSLVRPNRKNIVFIQGSGKRQIVVTSGCDVLRFASDEWAALYSIILRHNVIAHQIMRWNTGTSYPAVEKLRLDRILVPSVPREREVMLLAAAKSSVLGGERATTLIQAAIDDVEQLFNGTLDYATIVEDGHRLSKEFDLGGHG